MHVLACVRCSTRSAWWALLSRARIRLGVGAMWALMHNNEAQLGALWRDVIGRRLRSCLAWTEQDVSILLTLSVQARSFW